MTRPLWQLMIIRKKESSIDLTHLLNFLTRRKLTSRSSRSMSLMQFFSKSGKLRREPLTRDLFSLLPEEKSVRHSQDPLLPPKQNNTMKRTSPLMLPPLPELPQLIVLTNQMEHLIQPKPQMILSAQPRRLNKQRKFNK